MTPARRSAIDDSQGFRHQCRRHPGTPQRGTLSLGGCGGSTAGFTIFEVAPYAFHYGKHACWHDRPMKKVRHIAVGAAGRRSAYLFVLPWDLRYVGGVDQVIDNLWREMERDGRVRPLIMVSDWGHARPFATEVAGRPTVYYRLRDPSGAGLRSLLAFLIFLPATLMRLHGIIRQFGISAVNIHYPGNQALPFIILRWLGLYIGKIIFSFHGTDITRASTSRGMERLIWRLMLHHADARVVVSESMIAEVLAIAPRRSVTVVHNGLDVAGFLERRDHGFRIEQQLIDRPFVFCAAAFVARKGHDVLVESFAAIAREFPDLMLVLIGESKAGNYIDELRQQISHLALQDRVIMRENVPHAHVAAYFEKAKLFVLPSRAEPFGIVLLEAGAFGLPVVASRAGGIPEIIIDGENGKLVPPNDSAALAAAMAALLRAPGEAKRLGENLRRHVIENFTWRRTYQAYGRIIYGDRAVVP